MTILEEFVHDLRAALNDYQTRTFAGTLREARVGDIDDLMTKFQEATSAVKLRQDVLNKITEMKVGSFSLPAALDLNALKVRLKRVLKQKRYEPFNLLITENQEMQLFSKALTREVQNLKHQLATATALSPEAFESLDSEVHELRQTLDAQNGELIRLKEKNGILLEQVSVHNTSSEEYRLDAEKWQQKFSELHEKYLILLQKNKVFLESNQQPTVSVESQTAKEVKAKRIFGLF